MIWKNAHTWFQKTNQKQQTLCLKYRISPPCGWQETQIEIDTSGQSCLEGMHAADGTTDSMASCELCHPGYICPGKRPKGVADSVPCPRGTYNPIQGATSCETCHSGFYCPQNSSAPVPCGKGKYQPKDSICSLCPVGEYSDGENNTACKRCGEGESSLKGSTDQMNCTYEVSALVLIQVFCRGHDHGLFDCYR